jgi:hypothetical protein
MATSGMAKQ